MEGNLQVQASNKTEGGRGKEEGVINIWEGPHSWKASI